MDVLSVPPRKHEAISKWKRCVLFHEDRLVSSNAKLIEREKSVVFPWAIFPVFRLVSRKDQKPRVHTFTSTPCF